jgi:hypothetical protein
MGYTEQSNSEILEVELVPIRKDDYRLEQLDDELLLYHPSEEKIVYLNQTGSLIWGLCDGNHSIEQIISLLSQAFPDAADAITSDVQTTLKAFKKAGCIEVNSKSIP